ncbi:MAG TPA: lysylphosphatidylglycerol synthase domain-containing protein [Terracidiphilus sp.]
MAIAAVCIYIAFVFRAARWSLLMRHNKKVPLFSLLGIQVIGFTAVGLIGRMADPVRPYLVAKKTGEPLSSQFAIYIVERLFDFGTMALIVSLALLWIPQPALAAVPGQSGVVSHLVAPLIHRFPALSVVFTRFGALLLTMAGVLLLVAVRLSGDAVAGFFEKSFGLISRNTGPAIGHKIRAFHAGLDLIRSFSDFAFTASISLGMWCLIALAYVETVHPFTASPALAGLSLPNCVLLLMISGSVSVFQLPVLGWFSQIAFVAAALTSFFGAAPEGSTACSATLLLVTFLSIVPVGLIWARFEHLNLRKVALESEHAEEDLEAAKKINPAIAP